MKKQWNSVSIAFSGFKKSGKNWSRILSLLISMAKD